MELENTEETIQHRFEEVIGANDQSAVHEFLNHLNISDVAMLIEDNKDYEATILSSLSAHRAAATFKILDTPVQERIFKELAPFKAAELLNGLPPDDRTAFLEELPSNVVRELIKLLDPEERKITLSLLGYPEDSVGRLMTPDYVYVYSHNTMAEVFDTIRKYGKDSETINVVYVINQKGELLDDIRIGEVILSAPNKKVEELMDGRFIALHAFDDQETASEAFKMNNRVAL
ncbi:MAG: magnesium transporter, partial [Bacteroidota bacterium]